MSIESIIKNALTDFGNELRDQSWWGRENECVNRFAFRYLVPSVKPESAFYSSRQLGIEVAVPQHQGTASENKKILVRKDLVIWPSEDMTCWNSSGTHDPDNSPLAVLEWKANKTAIDTYDRIWLMEASARWPNFWGFAITVDLRRRKFLLSAQCIHQGRVDEKWLTIT